MDYGFFFVVCEGYHAALQLNTENSFHFAVLHAMLMLQYHTALPRCALQMQNSWQCSVQACDWPSIF